MSYELEILPKVKKDIYKARKKNKELEQALDRKIEYILIDPFKFKPLRNVFAGERRVHILKSFVLKYTIKENKVIITGFGHHDKAYE